MRILGNGQIFCAAVVATSMLLMPALAFAEDVPALAPYGGVGIHVGTAGLGLSYTYGINRYVDVRALYNFGSLSIDQEEDDIEYEAKLKFNSLAAMVDIKPFAGGFRLSLGLVSSSPELDLAARGLDDYELGNSMYTGDLAIDGGIDLGSSAPYLGLGWGGTANGSGFGVSFDIGVMLTGSPDVSLDVSGRACDSTAAACDPNGPAGFAVDGNSPQAQQFQANKEQEISNLEEDAKDFNLWPVLMLGFHYRF